MLFMKNIFNKIIAVVPPELQDKFDEIQLKTSIRRIRFFTIVAIAAKLINALFVYFANEHKQEYGLFNYIDYSELTIIAIFNLAIFFFRKSSKRRVQWLICYLFIASCYIIYEFAINLAGAPGHIPFIFFVSFFFFTIIPDFKPQIFITYSVLYFIATMVILMTKNMYINEYYGVPSHVLNIFVILLVTKILLYNSKVKTFVNTYEINKLNENLLSAKKELQNYNDNLEKMVVKKTERIVELQNTVLETVAELVECRDDATGCHVTRTGGYLKIFLDAVIESGLYKDQTAAWNIEQMVLSAQLHDVGKIAIDDAILRKPGKLTDEEFDNMKTHTVLGGDLIRNIQKKTGEQEFLDYAFIFAVYHHEKWNGSGYPYGKAGEDIPLPARLMAIIDVYDALISERPYKKAFTHEEAVKIIREEKGTHFDPALTELFLSISDSLEK